jgi:hypothetical protein
MPEKYGYNDLLTVSQVAEELGYTAAYLRLLLNPKENQYDPTFAVLKINTDESWRKAFESRAEYVFRYGEVLKWFHNHLERPTVQRYNESHGIIVE